MTSRTKANAKLISIGKGDKVWYSVEVVARCAEDDNIHMGYRLKNMVLGIHEHDQGEVCPQKIKVEIDKELMEIMKEMEMLALKMQQQARVRWRYEWPLKRKNKWYVQKLLARGKQQVLKKWLRHDEKLSDEESYLAGVS